MTRDPFIKKIICVLNDYLGIKEQQDITGDLYLPISMLDHPITAVLNVFLALESYWVKSH